jgi:competence protein ComEC
MVLGDKAGIDEEDVEAFRIAGTYHVLAISGAQVALLAALLVVPLRRAGVPRLPEAVLVTATLWAYAILVGADVPVVRAALMAGVLLLGRTVDLDSDLANLLGLAAFGLIVVRPSDVGDAGFQLSFAATLGLLVLSRPVAAWLPPLPLRLEWALAASAAAQLALVPLLLSWFHRLAPAALVLNLLAVPLASAVLVAGLAVVAASAFGAWMSSVAGQVAWWLAHALLASGQVVRGVPFLDARLPSPSPAAAAVYLIGLTLVAWGRRRRLALGVTALGLVAMVFGHPVPSGDGRLHLEVVDVGQGDCLVLRSPRGRTWMVDAGGSFDRAFDPGEVVVGPHLWDAGVTVIDTLLLTHAHPDHVGGVPFILRSFRVGEVWEGPAPRQDPTYSELDAGLARSGVARRTVFRGVRGLWDDVAYEVLGPAPQGPGSRRTRNDDSVVLSVSLGVVRFLLAGDIESHGEEALQAPPALVLKVPHHGSRTSSTPAFVARVAPRVAVLSVGYRSPFGHPHPEVLARYVRAGVRVYRTDRDGTVRVSTDGRSLWVRTAAGGSDERLR